MGDDALIFSKMDVGGRTQECIRSKDLHSALCVGRAHSHWIADRIDRLGLAEGDDFVQVERGGSARSWQAVYLTQGAALRIAVEHRSFRGVDTPEKKELRRQLSVLQEALLSLQPELRKAYAYAANSSLTDAERATLMGWPEDRWAEAADQLRSMGMLA